MSWPFRCFTLRVDIDRVIGLAVFVRCWTLTVVVGCVIIRLEVRE